MTEMLKGIAASDGVAVAKAYLLVQPDLSFETITVEDTMQKKLALMLHYKLHKTSFLLSEKSSRKLRRGSGSSF